VHHLTDWRIVGFSLYHFNYFSYFEYRKWQCRR
jgi:hypothetical protein